MQPGTGAKWQWTMQFTGCALWGEGNQSDRVPFKTWREIQIPEIKLVVTKNKGTDLSNKN